MWSYIRRSIFSQLGEEDRKSVELSVVDTALPCAALYAVLALPLEVLFKVVYD